MHCKRSWQNSADRLRWLMLGAVLFFVLALAGCGGSQSTSDSSSPGSLSVNPSTVAFGNIVVGNTTTKTAAIFNTGGSNVTISEAAVSGSGYGVAGINVPVTLSAGQSLSFTASFEPTSTGASNGTLSLTSNGSNPQLTIVLSGTGVAPGQLAVNPLTLSFGNVNAGQSQTLSGTLTAGQTDVNVSSASVDGASFTLGGIELPTTIASGQSSGFTITFSPTRPGTVNNSISFVSNASNSPITVSLSGTCEQSPARSVALSWVENSRSVQGYYVYRGGKSGGPYTRISELQPVTSYVDSSVVSGTTYYYVVTAVGIDSSESANSNEVTAVIPQ